MKKLAKATRHELMEKALNIGFFKEGMAEGPVYERYPELVGKFREGLTVHSSLLQVDLSPFSSHVAGKPPAEVREILETYYATAIDVIDNHGGVVEKYIGDAVLALFGKPFQDTTAPQGIDSAYQAAKRLINEIYSVFDGELVGKVALAHGDCFMGYVGPDIHRELTVVGNPLTTLFRLENICPQDGVALLTSHRDAISAAASPVASGRAKAPWTRTDHKYFLKGVGSVMVTKLNRNR